MKIGIIGAGNMGGTLGTLWAKKGHKVIFSFSRDLEKLTALAQAAGETARVKTPRQAVEESEILLLSVWPAALSEALEAAGSLDGKIIITCMSGIKPDFSGQVIGLPSERTISMAEEVSKLAPGAKVVEAFNITFAEAVASGDRLLNGERATIFLCGQDADAKLVAAQLITDAGYDPLDAGGLHTARSLETLASAWVQFAVVSGLFPNLGLRAVRW